MAAPKKFTAMKLILNRRNTKRHLDLKECQAETLRNNHSEDIPAIRSTPRKSRRIREPSPVIPERDLTRVETSTICSVSSGNKSETSKKTTKNVAQKNGSEGRPSNSGGTPRKEKSDETSAAFKTPSRKSTRVIEQSRAIPERSTKRLSSDDDCGLPKKASKLRKKMPENDAEESCQNSKKPFSDSPASVSKMNGNKTPKGKKQAEVQKERNVSEESRTPSPRFHIWPPVNP